MKSISASIVCLLVFVLSSVVYSGGIYSGGSGIAGDPYRISTAADLDDIGNHTDDYAKCFILTNDVDMTGYSYTAAVIAPDTDNTSWTFQGTRFTGTFDGNGFAVYNLTVDGSGSYYTGLFGSVSGGLLKNLAVINCSVSGKDYVGAVAGSNGNSGGIVNCESSGEIGGVSYLGGIAGENTASASIQNCRSSCTMSGSGNSYMVGGLVGDNSYSATVVDCCSSGRVNGSSNVGGLAGRSHSASIARCYSTGAVSGSTGVGGLVGVCSSSIENCYSNGDVSGVYNIGGFVGNNSSGSVSDCYSSGHVTGGATYSEVGGFCGYQYGSASVMSNCFWDVDTSGMTVGYYQNPSPLYSGTVTNVVGKTDEQMRIESTFTDAGWDFVDEEDNGTDGIWQIESDGADYPRFWWQLLSMVNLSGSLGVDELDIAFFGYRWLFEDCDLDDDCQGADIDGSGKVDLVDWCCLAENWLK